MDLLKQSNTTDELNESFQINVKMVLLTLSQIHIHKESCMHLGNVTNLQTLHLLKLKQRKTILEFDPSSDFRLHHRAAVTLTAGCCRIQFGGPSDTSALSAASHISVAKCPCSNTLLFNKGATHDILIQSQHVSCVFRFAGVLHCNWSGWILSSRPCVPRRLPGWPKRVLTFFTQGEMSTVHTIPGNYCFF